MAADYNNIAGLKIIKAGNLCIFTYTAPSGRSDVALAYSCLIQTPVYESGTVKGVRPFGPIHIGTAELRTCNGYQGGGFPASA
jgi:hypothetical protein